MIDGNTTMEELAVRVSMALDTEHGPLRIITPTLSVMDRLAAYWYHGDRQTWDQATEIVKRQEIDWDYILAWARNERQDESAIERLRELSEPGR